MFPQLYHAHHSRNLEDLPFWLALAEQNGGPVLELGCGTGRVLIALARAGYATVGIDHDLSMLRFLLANLEPQVHPMPLILAADIGKFHLAVEFPLIILPCNTYTTLDEQQRVSCLACVGRHLTPKGVFAVSLPNPQWLQELPSRSEVELEDEFIHPQTGNPVQVSSAWERHIGRFSVKWFYDHLLPDGTVERVVKETSHHLNSLQSYINEFERAGLVATGIYGDYDRSANTSDAAQLVILAAPDSY